MKNNFNTRLRQEASKTSLIHQINDTTTRLQCEKILSHLQRYRNDIHEYELSSTGQLHTIKCVSPLRELGHIIVIGWLELTKQYENTYRIGKFSYHGMKADISGGEK